MCSSPVTDLHLASYALQEVEEEEERKERGMRGRKVEERVRKEGGREKEWQGLVEKGEEK